MARNAENLTVRLDQALILGQPAPWFVAPVVDGNPNFSFSTVGGRYLLMLFFDSAAPVEVANALALVHANRRLFNDIDASFFGVSADPEDTKAGRIAMQLPGVRFFEDHDCVVRGKYHLADREGAGRIRPDWIIVDPMMRIIARFALESGDTAIRTLREALDRGYPSVQAPVLIVPHILEPDLCLDLINHYNSGATRPSGFMLDVNGKTTLQRDAGYKVRTDHSVLDEEMRGRLMLRVARRLLPLIRHSFKFNATRMERYLVARYDAETGGHFSAHRDDTALGTVHRKFAVTINLNAEGYDGGNLVFPEFGKTEYRAPTGGAAVFSCSLLHRAMPVTRGSRYAFLPFLYDDESAALRKANNRYLGDEVTHYGRD